MRVYLLTAPTWVQAALGGATLGAFVAVLYRTQPLHGGTPDGVLPAVLVAVITGTIGTAVSAQRRRPQRDLLTALPPNQRRTALRATRRGAPPANPSLRHAAAQLAIHERRQLLEQRGINMTLTAALAALSIALAALGAPWWAAAALTAVSIGILINLAWQPSHLHHRITLLEADS